MQIGFGQAIAKTILFGEHSVVYGHPAVAIPLKQLQTKVEIVTNQEFQFIYNNKNIPIAILNQTMNGFFQLVEALFSYFDIDAQNKNLKISVESNIPNKSGLGSSASISVALTRAFFDFYGEELDEETLERFANMSEMINHSNASGLDVQTIISQAPIQFSKSEGITKLRLNVRGYILLLDSNEESSTSKAVSKVHDFLVNNPENATRIFEKITRNEELALKSNSLEFGPFLTKNHLLLKELGVSSDVLDGLVDRLVDLGATGAKLTGGGLGGSVIGFFLDLETATQAKKALEDQYSIWISEL